MRKKKMYIKKNCGREESVRGWDKPLRKIRAAKEVAWTGIYRSRADAKYIFY